MRLSFSGFFVLLSTLSAPAHAFSVILTNSGNPITWADTPVTWYLSKSPTDVSLADALAALQSSFDSWQAVGCSQIAFDYGGTTSNPSAGLVVKWQEASWDLATGDALAVTTNWSIKSSGATRVEILFNGVDYEWTTTGISDPFSKVEDIEEVAAHEIGHAIGLDHSRDTEATMWFTSQAEADASSLGADDQRGACYLYPNGTFDDGLACDACVSDAGCADGLCINFSAEEGLYCGKTCSSSSDCADTYACYELEGAAEPQCLPTNFHCAPVGKNIEIGEFCYDHSTCASGQCLTLQKGAVCTQSCTAGGASNGGCPASMTCLGDSGDSICYPKGTGNVGDTCLGSFDCASFECVGVGGGKGVCSQDCKDDAGCPDSGFRCVTGVCIPRGDVAFGGQCESDDQCQSAVCFGSACSETCGDNSDCPGEATCGDNGYCKPGPTGELHAVCGNGVTTCKSAYICVSVADGDATGQCEKGCDTRVDDCEPGLRCRRLYQSALDKVVGFCTDDAAGAVLDAACGGPGSCQHGLVCADLGAGLFCHRDCNAKNLLGCDSGQLCVAVGGDTDPKLGACKSTTSPIPGSDLAAGSDTSATPSDDLGSPTPPDGSTESPGADTSGMGVPDAGPSSSKGKGRSGGCSISSPRAGSFAAIALVFGALAILCLRDRRRPSCLPRAESRQRS